MLPMLIVFFKTISLICAKLHIKISVSATFSLGEYHFYCAYYQAFTASCTVWPIITGVIFVNMNLAPCQSHTLLLSIRTLK